MSTLAESEGVLENNETAEGEEEEEDEDVSSFGIINQND